jgi:hypothetical protein
MNIYVPVLLLAEGLNRVESVSINQFTFANKVWAGSIVCTVMATTCLCGVPGVLGSSAHAGPHDGEGMAAPGRELAIIDSYHLPLAEVSGLARIPALSTNAGKSGNSLDLYAVGDASYQVVRFHMGSVDGARSARQEPDIRVQDVAHALDRQAGKASQWEAAAVDGKGSVCMLSETHAEIACMDAGLHHAKGRFTLDVSGIPALDSAWKEQPNSRGEGMLLMKKGHVLVLKEKKPSMLIEFGPEGDQPMGYAPDAFLEAGEEFAGLGGGSSDSPIYRASQVAPARELAPPRLVALKAWEFSDRLHELAPDASEIALGPDGRVYLLSEESATLIRLEKTLKPGERKVGMERGAYWRLPRGMDKAEGLVIDDSMHPWIGIDIKQANRPNLFRLSPLDDQP